MFPRKYRIHAVLLLSALLIIFLPKFTQRPDQEKIEAATPAMAEFLQLIDTDQFAESWRSSASLLKERVSEPQWVEQLSRIRELAGQLEQRTDQEITFSTMAQGSPEGEYLLVQFDTDFARKKAAREILTLMLDTDGRWRVAGYFIK